MKWIKKVASTSLDDEAKVIDTLDSQENDRKNAPSIHAVREAIEAFFATIYPVGSIYMNTGAFNPGDVFGGVWEKIEDRYLLAAGTAAAGSTGGANYIDVTPSGTVQGHALTTSELPKHVHYYTDRYTDAVDHQTLNYTVGTDEVSFVNAVHVNERETTTGQTGSDNPTHSHGFTGSTTRYTYKPEYIAVNVWQRIG